MLTKISSPRRVMTLVAMAASLGGITGCTSAQQMELTMFVQDFLRNLLFGLAF